MLWFLLTFILTSFTHDYNVASNTTTSREAYSLQSTSSDKFLAKPFVIILFTISISAGRLLIGPFRSARGIWVNVWTMVSTIYIPTRLWGLVIMNDDEYLLQKKEHTGFVFYRLFTASIASSIMIAWTIFRKLAKNYKKKILFLDHRYDQKAKIMFSKRKMYLRMSTR